MNLSLEEFASTISKYASSKDKNNSLIADETIAEAVHDYYLHEENMKSSSREIIAIIKSRLWGAYEKMFKLQMERKRYRHLL